MKQPSIQRAAVGFRVHSGWAVLVVPAEPVKKPTILVRKHIEIADAEIVGSKQPYHAAQELELSRAEKLIASCVEASLRLAKKELKAAVNDAMAKGYKVSTSGVLTGSARPLPTLESILSSHPLLHAAEGELFRQAIMTACRDCGLSVFSVKESEVLVRSSSVLGISEKDIQQHLASTGETVGSPWRQDEKLATRVAWLALAAEAQRKKARVS